MDEICLYCGLDAAILATLQQGQGRPLGEAFSEAAHWRGVGPAELQQRAGDEPRQLVSLIVDEL